MDIAKLDPGLSPNGAIVLVDAPQFHNQLTDSMIKDAVLTQVKEADILLINKANLASQTTVEAVRETLNKHHSDCALLINDQDNFDPRPLFDSIHMASSIAENDMALVDTKATSDHWHGHTHDQFHSCVLQHSKPLDRHIFESWATALPPSVIRGKGVISFTESPHQQWIWQKVGRTYHLEHSSITCERSSKVVLIGTEGMPTDTDPKFYGPFSTQ